MSSSLLTPGEFPDYLKAHSSMPKYDSAKEDRFPHPWLEVDRPEIDKGLKDISALVVKIISEIPKDDIELSHILRAAESLPQVPRSDPVKVAFIGPQGAGKSLGLNALFDRDGLSLTGADGQACTSAIIKYEPYGRDTTIENMQSYIAHIKFFDAVKLEQMIAEHARAYFHYQHFDEDSDDEDGPKIKSLAQDESDRRMKDTAEEIFSTFFGGREQFQNVWSPNEYRSGEFGRLCQVKCEQAINTLNINSQRIATVLGNNAKELLKKIKRFITKVEGEDCLWPLVDHVSIRFHHPLLDENLEIIDLPGWGDINVLRARHADEVKDIVDVEIILADTIRIATDDLVISNARAAALNHGAAMVKLVATKIDAISENQLAQCSGPNYDPIKTRIQIAEDDALQAEEEDDEVRSSQASKYKSYLERKLKQRKVMERAKTISKDLNMKLKGRSSDDSIHTFHVSAADYMTWIKKEKLRFREQPALFPEDTGIPNLRRFLFYLPAKQNLDDYQTHVFINVPAFVDKTRRIVDNTDRDVGFRSLADDFDKLRSQFIPALLKIAKTNIKRIVTSSVSKMRTDANIYRDQLDAIIHSWMQIKPLVFVRILKCKGLIPPGTSRAKGLEYGCDWNQELSKALMPGFKKVHSAQLSAMESIGPALIELSKHFNGRVLTMMNNSASSLPTIEKAKRRWERCPETIEAKLAVLMDQLRVKLNGLMRRATMEDSRQNSFISTLTDPIFDDVFKACPEEKPTSTPQKRKYVEPKTRFQRRTMRHHFQEQGNHFLDKTLKELQQLIDSTMSTVLEEHIEGIDKYLEKFSAILRTFAPLEYQITEIGAYIRSELEKIIPELDEKANNMCHCFPKHIKQEGSNSQAVPYGAPRTKNADVDLEVFFDQALKRKKVNTSNSGMKIKREPGTKRSRIE